MKPKCSLVCSSENEQLEHSVCSMFRTVGGTTVMLCKRTDCQTEPCSPSGGKTVETEPSCSWCLAVMQRVLALSSNLRGIVSLRAPPHAAPLMILSCNETFSFVSISTVCLWTSGAALKAQGLMGRDRMS